GVVAALAVAFVSPQMRVPGHAILKATLPIVLGVAVVPRWFSGTIAGIASAATVGCLLATGRGNLQPAAVTALLAIGPAVDLAMSRAGAAGWRLYLRFAIAGLLANMLAFAVRWGAGAIEPAGAQHHMMNQPSLVRLLSFAACGLIAGLI